MAVTRDDVHRAANALLNETNLVPGKITIALVRERLGGTGSQPTIAKYLREWKAAQKTESALPSLVSAAGIEFIEQIWTSAKAEAEKEYHEERRMMASMAEEMQTLLEQSEAAQKDLEASLSVAHAAADRAQAEADQLTNEANRLSGDLADTLKSKEELAAGSLELERKVSALEAQLVAKDELHAQALKAESDKLELLKAAMAPKDGKKK